MATFSRSSFIPKSIALNPQCKNDPVVLELKGINNNMRKIDAYVVLGIKGKRKQIEDQRKKDTDSKRREKKLSIEKQRKVNPINFIKEKLPRTGFLDAIRNFILYTAMGMAVPFALKNLPKILGVVKFILPIYKVFEDFMGNVLGGIVSAVDFGYKVHDKIRGILKKVTGDKFEKSFEDLEKNLNTFLNLAVVLGLAVAGSGGIPMPKGPKGNRVPSGGPPATKLLPSGSLSRVNDSYARFIAGDANIGDRARLARRGYIDVQDTLTKGGSNALAKRAARRAAAKTGGKFIGKFARVFGRVPVVGGLIDFALSMMMGEKPGRAAAKAIGSTIGAGLGSFIPVPGVGTILGGIIGDIVGGALYDTLSSFGKPQKHATGGRVGSKSYSRIPRTIKKAKAKRPPKQLRQRTMPGKNVGGEDAIKKLFPDSDKEDTMSPLRLLKKNAGVMKKAGVFGNLLSSGVEMMALGQKIERPTLMGLEKYLAFVIDSSIDDQTATNAKMLGSSMFAMAGGGIVPASRTISQSGTSPGQVVAKEIVRSFTAMLDNRSSEIFQNIRKELELQAPMGATETGPGTPGTGAGDSSNAGVVFNALMAAGFSFNQAAGIVGNLMQESGGGTTNLNTKAENFIGNGHIGIAQWDKRDRWPAVKAYIQSIKKDPFSIEGQAAGLIWELQTKEKKAYNLLKRTSSPEGAAAIFLKEFERSGEVPGQEGYDNRIQNAIKLSQMFQSGQMAPLSGGDSIIGIGKEILKLGFSIGENKFFTNNAWSKFEPNPGGFNPLGNSIIGGHGSKDHSTNALDITDHRGQPPQNPGEIKRLTNLFLTLYQNRQKYGIKALIYDHYGSWFQGEKNVTLGKYDGNHYDHLHVGFKTGVYSRLNTNSSRGGRQTAPQTRIPVPTPDPEMSQFFNSLPRPAPLPRAGRTPLGIPGGPKIYIGDQSSISNPLTVASSSPQPVLQDISNKAVYSEISSTKIFLQRVLVEQTA
jgi:hypothetical protein